MDKHSDKLYNELRIYFIASIVISILLFIVIQLRTGAGNAYLHNVLLERYGILFTLAGIPVGLKFFHNKLKKLKKNDMQEYRRKYKLNYIIRLGILETVYFFNLASLYLTGAKNFSFMIIITIFALFLCAPQRADILKEKEITDTDTN